MGPFDLLKEKVISEYTKDNWNISVSSGPKVQIDFIFRLALVKKAKLNGEERATNEFYRSTLHGLVDDIEKKKKIVKVEKLFSKKEGDVEVILVEGIPGIGKTKLACYLCSMWAKGELLRKFNLVIYVQLRRFQCKSPDRVFCINDLIQPYLSCSDRGKNVSVAERLADIDFENTLLILDGWDELAPHLRSESSYFHDIIAGNSNDFKNASVMVTSRCTVSHQLRHLIDKHVEVLGLDTEQEKEYISGCIPHKMEMVLAHLKKFPNIQALSHIPMILGIICSIIQVTDTLPSTLTKLYDLYIRNLLFTNLKKHKKYCEITEISSLIDLPPEILKVVESLAYLALKGLLEDCLVFEKKDLEEVGIFQPGFDAYGLLSVHECYDEAGVRHLYQFYHLTLQEFLAAWYANLKELDRGNMQLNRLCQCRHERKYHLVWKFFSGLTKLRNKSSRDAIISSTTLKNNKENLLLLHCVYEADDPSVCVAAATHLRRELHLDNMFLNPTDCQCLAFTLAHARGRWTLNLRCCNIGRDEFNVLFSNLTLEQPISNVGQVSFSRIE